MKTRKTILTLAIVFALALFACEKDPDPKTYTVTFDADGGTPAPQTQTVTEGGKATKPEDPAKALHTLEHWINTTTTTQYDFNTPVNSNITLKAKWLNKTEPAAPWQGANFTISYIYNKDLTPESDIEKIKSGIASIEGYSITYPESQFETTANNMNARGGNFTVIVIYGDDNSFDSFRAKDGRTTEVHNIWLSANNTGSFTSQNALAAMLALPDPLAE